MSKEIDDLEEAKRCVVNDPFEVQSYFGRCSDRLRDDSAFAMLAVQTEMNLCTSARITFELCSERLKDDLDFCTWATKRSPILFLDCSERLRDDAAFASAVVATVPAFRDYCSERLRNDANFNTMVDQYPKDAYLAPLTDQEREYFAEEIIDERGNHSDDNLYRYEHAPAYVRADIDLARVLVQDDPMIFEKCVERVRDQTDIAALALNRNFLLFSYCSERLHDDPDFARTAIVNAYEWIADKDQAKEYAQEYFGICSERLQNDRDFVASVIEKVPCVFECCSYDEDDYDEDDNGITTLADDNDIATLAVEKDPENIEFCSERMRSDPKFQAYVELVAAEQAGRQPNLSPFPKFIKDAHLAATTCHDKNCTAFRETFAIYAVQFEATAMAQQQGQQQQPLPRQVTPDAVLADVDAFDLSPSR